jgi:hypothetical protein
VRPQTPYVDFTTPEVVAARRSLTLLVSGNHGTQEQRDSLGDLVVWATIELAERLSAFVEHVDGKVFGAALESLAIDLGIVRGPLPQPPPPHLPPMAPIPPAPGPQRSRSPLRPIELVGGRFVRR